MSEWGLIVDCLIIVVYFVLIVGIGIYAGKREGSLHEFALGGRRIPWWAVMASIIAAETSAATFLGIPGEGYSKLSLAYVQIMFGLILGRVLVGYLFLKPYYLFKVYTVYDYLAIRFGDKSKNYVSALFLIMRTLASGTRLFVPSVVIVLAWVLLVQGKGNVEFSINTIPSVWPYVWAIAGITLVTFLYTAIGGIKAVIWTDVIQACLMFGSAIVAIFTLLYHVGGDSWNLLNGFRAVGETVPQMKTLSGYINTGFEPEAVAKFMTDESIPVMGAWEYIRMIFQSEYTLFSALIGATAANMAAFGTDQDMVQRLLTAETYKKSRRSLITAALMDLPIAAAFSFIGVLLYVYYTQDPTYKPAANADVFGSYILNVMPVGIRGLVLAGIFATAMGSLSAALNSLATSATNDWYIPYFAKNSTDSHQITAARIFTGLFALFMIGIAVIFAYAKIKNPELRIIQVVLGIAGFILGPMLGVFLLGMLTKTRGSDTGNMIAISIGLILTIIGGELHIVFAELCGFSEVIINKLKLWQENIPTIAFTWYTFVGALIVFLVGLMFKTPREVIDSMSRRKTQAEAEEEDERPIHLRD